MSIIDSLRAWSKAKKITVSVIAAVAVAAVGITIFLINRNMILATTMRLLKVVGTVNIEDASGTVKPVIDNIRFQSGDTLSTGSDGLASIGLDDTKIVTLQNDSSAQFIKNGKQIELKLKQGGVFFEVTEKLTDDETYEIETSNMTVGIRGTSGYVWYDESGLQSLVITDGKVLVSGHNPQTGETKTVEVCGGQQVSCFLYNDITEERTSIEFELKDLDESELPEFPLQMLAENPDLMEKVCAETGWDKDELLALVDALLDPDNPTPTPDAIIEITDTPTATPTVIPTVTPTVTDAPIPLISPTTSPTPTTTPAAGTTVTPTPGATTTPTTTPTATPTSTPTSTPVPTVASYTVSFDMNGVGKAPADQTVENGKKASEPEEPAAEGYRFGGWYTNSGCTDKYDFSSRVTKDITLYAKWTRVTCTVRFNTDGIGSAPDDQIISYGGTVSAPAAPSAEGYTFGGWYINDDLTEKYDFDSEVTSSFTLFAKWTRITYTVDFDTDDLGTEPSAQTVAHGDTVSVPAAPSAEGYTFDGWYVDDDRTEEYDFGSEVTSSFTLYAGWTLNSYTVSFNANGHGSAPDDQIIYYGDYAISPDYPTVEGYTCSGWYVDESCTEFYDFNTPVTSDVEIYAGWTINTYNVTFNANGLGTAPDAQKVDYGGKVTKPADLSVTGYTFGGWYTDPGCTTSYDFDSAVKSDVTLYAKWILNSYNVTFNANGHGSAPAAQTVNYGYKASKPTDPTAEGYTFSGWYTNAACTTAYSFDSTVTGDVVLYAGWVLNQYTVTFDANGQGTAPATQTVSHGGKVKKPSNLTSSIYIFDGWYKDAACTNSYDFNSSVTSDLILYAKWIGPDDTIPSGYNKMSSLYPWGKEYNGTTVYIVCASDNSHDPDVDYYKGWLNHQWVNLSMTLNHEAGYTTETYKYNNSIYYEGSYYSGLG